MLSPDHPAPSLRAGRSGDRIPVGVRYAPFQNGTGTHTASSMGTESVSREYSGRGNGVDHPTPASAEVEERV